MGTLQIIILTILVYSTTTTAIYFLSKCDNNVAQWLAVGVLSIIVLPMAVAYNKISVCVEYKNKRSIICDNDLQKYLWCNIKDTNDIIGFHKRYSLERRYALKKEWSKYEEIDKVLVDELKNNCDHCNVGCDTFYHDNLKCKTDNYEFFEHKEKKLFNGRN